MKIKELKIQTPNLPNQTDFYTKVLGLQVSDKSLNSVSFEIGSSILTFIEKEGACPYHFAFNIPANKEHQALEWLKDRVDILHDGDNEILDFVSWNAKAIYFYDTDKNIVEFIARKNLDNASGRPFDQNDLLEVSEIGVPTQSIEAIYDALHSALGIEVYDGTFELFCAIGDETGLFICVNKDKKLWYPVNDTPFLSDFEAIVEVNEKRYNVVCVEGNINVSTHALIN